MKLLTYTNLFFFIILFVLTENTCAQKPISGIITNEIKTSDGIVKIVLPKHIPMGKTISGTITEEPLSNSAKDVKRFNKRDKLKLKIGNATITDEGIFNFTVPENESVLLSVSDSKGKIINETSLATEPPVNHQQLKIPAVIRKYYPEKLTGDFSGDITNASVKIDEKPANILAGNESELFFETNDAEPGRSTISVEYDQLQEKQQINVVDYTIQADKTSLNRGESTQLKVNIIGLKDLQEPLKFELNNQSEQTVLLEGGNTQNINISPEEVSETGTWDRQFRVQSIARGTFSISTFLEVPSSTEPQDSSDLVSCNLENIPVIITAEQCDEFQERLNNYTPVENPYFTDKSEIPDVNFYEGNFDYGPDNLLKTEINISPEAEPLFSQVKIIDIASNQVVYSEIDSTIEDGYSSLVSTDFNPGLYSLQNSVFFGSGQQVSHTQLFYQNGVYSYAGITNSEISRIEDNLEDARDSVQRLRRRYDNLDSLRRENERKARDEDDEAWNDEEIASQLEKIDRVLDQVEDIYSDDLRNLLDSIVNYPEIPDTAALRNYVDQLQDELDKCKKQLQDLEDEKSKLEKDIPNIQARQQAAYQKIVDAFKDSGYNFMARRSRDANGDFHYGYTVILGTTGYKGYVPAEIASQVTAQENELKDLANQLQQARQRLAELPGIIADKQKECDDLNDQLQKAKEALKNGTSLAQNYSRMQLKRDDICKRIKAISQRLVRWCNNHPDLCSFADDLEKLLDNCPKTAAEADSFWRNYQRVLDAKKRLENNYHESAKTHSSNADDLRKRADDESEEQNDIWDELGRLARRIQRLEAAKARAIADEQRRQAQMAREKKRACEKILEQQGIDPSNASVLKDLEDIKNKIQEVGGMISDAAKLGEKIPNAKIKEMAAKLGKNIDEILGPLEKYDELKDKADKLLEVKDKLATLFSEGDSPSEQAAKFGAYLELVNDIVGEIGDKFPILKFFTAYFDYLVQGYLAAVNGAERAFTDRYEEIIESGLDRLNCEQLLEKYMKNNSFEDMYRYAEKACGISYYGQNKWQRENFSRIVREKTLKKIIDCCLYKLSK